MPGWAMAAWADWRLASSIQWPRWNSPAMGYGLRYEYGMFKQTIKMAGKQEQADSWLHRPDPWEIVRPQEKVEIPMNCSFECARARCARYRANRQK